MASGLVVCRPPCRRIGVLARSCVAFLRNPHNGWAISDLVCVRDRQGLGLAQRLLLAPRVYSRSRHWCSRGASFGDIVHFGARSNSFELTCISRAVLATLDLAAAGIFALGWLQPFSPAHHHVDPPAATAGAGQSLAPNRARAFRRRTGQPSLRDRARPDGRSRGTTRSAGHGSQQHCRASSVGVVGVHRRRGLRGGGYPFGGGKCARGGGGSSLSRMPCRVRTRGESG